MRLATHNFLQSNVKGTEKGYPLIIEASEVVIEESPVDRELLDRMLQKIDYAALKQAVAQLGPHCGPDGLPDLPDELPDSIDEELAAQLNKVVFDVHLIAGFLICPDTQRKFPVKEGIPNMVLHEDEL